MKASTIPLMAATIENCITALWGLVRATLANTESLSDEAMLRLISFCRRAHDGVQNDAITENAVFTAIGIIATLCEDRSHCERLMLLGARPETPPPFTAEEIAEFELAEFKARREGKKFVRPVREKLPWDYNAFRDRVALSTGSRSRRTMRAVPVPWPPCVLVSFSSICSQTLLKKEMQLWMAHTVVC